MAGKPTPPDYAYPDDAGGERPPYVLIDPKAYFADRANATTAVCEMNGPDLKLKGRLQVTFCVVAPPLVSYFCIHATDMSPTEFAMDPHILATETGDGLVLLCVFLDARGQHERRVRGTGGAQGQRLGAAGQQQQPGTARPKPTASGHHQDAVRKKLRS